MCSTYGEDEFKCLAYKYIFFIQQPLYAKSKFPDMK